MVSAQLFAFHAFFVTLPCVRLSCAVGLFAILPVTIFTMCVVLIAKIVTRNPVHASAFVLVARSAKGIGCIGNVVALHALLDNILLPCTSSAQWHEFSPNRWAKIGAIESAAFAVGTDPLSCETIHTAMEFGAIDAMK